MTKARKPKRQILVKATGEHTEKKKKLDIGTRERTREHRASLLRFSDWGARSKCCATKGCCARFSSRHVQLLRQLYMGLDKPARRSFLLKRIAHTSSTNAAGDEDDLASDVSSDEDEVILPVNSSSVRRSFYIDDYEWVRLTFDRQSPLDPDRALNLVPVCFAFFSHAFDISRNAIYKMADDSRRLVIRPSPVTDSIISWLQQQGRYYQISPGINIRKDLDSIFPV